MKAAARTPLRLLCAALVGAGVAGCSGWDYAMGAAYGGTTAAAGAGAAGAAAAGSTVAAAGTTGLYVSITLSATAANIMAAATGVAIYAAMLQESGEWQPHYYPMLKGRAINEQDCTKPIVDMKANLKCK